MTRVALKYELLADTCWQLQTKFHTMLLVRYLEHVVNEDVYDNTANFGCLRQAVFYSYQKSHASGIKVARTY